MGSLFTQFSVRQIGATSKRGVEGRGTRDEEIFDTSPFFLAAGVCFLPTTLTRPPDTLSRSRGRGTAVEAEEGNRYADMKAEAVAQATLDGLDDFLRPRVFAADTRHVPGTALTRQAITTLTLISSPIRWARSKTARFGQLIPVHVGILTTDGHEWTRILTKGNPGNEAPKIFQISVSSVCFCENLCALFVLPPSFHFGATRRG